MLMCKICIARRLVVDIFPWCNANFVPFPSGTLVARRMRNERICRPFKHYLLKGTKRSIKLISVVIVGCFVSASSLLHPFISALHLCITLPLDNELAGSFSLQVQIITGQLSRDEAFVTISQLLIILGVVIVLVVNLFLYTQIILTLQRRKHNKTLHMSAYLERNLRQVS